MEILHTSDLHGNVPLLLKEMATNTFAVWVDSGDFFPNLTRGDASVEEPFQREWFQKHAADIKAALAGRPVIIIPGNHDYVDLAELLREHGVWAWNLAEGSIILNGFRFAGFREIPHIIGEWKGETYRWDFRPIIDRMVQEDPHILVTHAPSAGVLDWDANGKHWGIAELSTAIQYRLNNLRAHLHGHVHHMGDSLDMCGGVQVSNAAQAARVLIVGEEE